MKFQIITNEVYVLDLIVFNFFQITKIMFNIFENKLKWMLPKFQVNRHLRVEQVIQRLIFSIARNVEEVGLFVKYDN